MKQFTTTCTQCPKTFTKTTQQKADHAMAIHHGQLHKPGGRKGGKKAKSAEEADLYEAVADLGVKRSYVKRAKAAKATTVSVNFCPNCGCNLHNVAVGLALAGS